MYPRPIRFVRALTLLCMGSACGGKTASEPPSDASADATGDTSVVADTGSVTDTSGCDACTCGPGTIGTPPCIVWGMADRCCPPPPDGIVPGPLPPPDLPC